jgi:hypothetical protein
VLAPPANGCCAGRLPRIVCFIGLRSRGGDTGSTPHRGAP